MKTSVLTLQDVQCDCERLHDCTIFFEKLVFPVIHTFNLCAKIIYVCEGHFCNSCIGMGTINFFSPTSSRQSDATVEWLFLVYSAEHLASELRYTALDSGLVTNHLSTSLFAIGIKCMGWASMVGRQ